MAIEIVPNDVEINYHDYKEEIVREQTEVQAKINELEIKLVDLELKERMIDSIISRTNATLLNIPADNFKWMGQTQSNLMKQIENLGLVKDIIIKYEDMILKYRNVLISIIEKKITNRVKIVSLQKEEKQAENSIGDLMVNIQDLLSGKAPQIEGEGEQPFDPEAQKLFLNSIEEELKKEGY